VPIGKTRLEVLL